MVIFIRYFLIFTIITIQLKLTLSDSLNYVVDGNLLEKTQFNFSMSIKHLIGILMFCIDSNGNQVGVAIEPGNGYENYISVSFNRFRKLFSLKVLCGCDPCDETLLEFYFFLHRRKINVSCNNQVLGFFDISGHGNGAISEKIRSLLPIPMEIFNRENLMFIMVGDIGPYQSKDQKTIFPSKNQLTGCLGIFKFNNRHIKFQSNGPDTLKDCPQRCINDVCNAGICRELYLSVVCNCSLTALNGLYCDKRMKNYVSGANNSYDVVKDIYHVYAKISWRQAWYRKYCIMEIITRELNFTIWINDNRLMGNDEEIGENNFDGTNFVSINLTHANLIVNTIKRQSTHRLSLSDMIRVNVGFSEINFNCEIFEGVNDIYFYPTLTQRRYSTKINGRNTVTTFSSICFSLANVVIVVLVICAAIPVSILSLTLGLCVLFRRKIAANKSRNSNGLAETEFRKDNHNEIDLLLHVEETSPLSNSESMQYFSNDTLPPIPQTICRDNI